AEVHHHVSILRPSQFGERLPQRGDTQRHFRIGFRCPCQNADAPHTLCLLRARRERPRGGRAANERDELATVAVGTPVTGRPPRGSVRAAFPHTALTSGHDGKCWPYAPAPVTRLP